MYNYIILSMVLVYSVTNVLGQQGFDREICEEAPTTTSCRAAINMWYFNSTTRECDEFIWGGCPGGSLNKFPTREACIRNCNPEICALPAVVGGCRANIKLWFYDIDHRKCNQFHYGGCDGNTNRFGSQEGCETACAGTNLACELGKGFDTVGYKSVHSDYREKDWFTSGCTRKCKEKCLDDHPWGACMAYSTRKRWYTCICYLYDRKVSELEFDSGTSGVTRNRRCAKNKE